jgi:hypothetical protein
VIDGSRYLWHVTPLNREQLEIHTQRSLHIFSKQAGSKSHSRSKDVILHHFG